jgi:hypothetical protein
LHKGERLQLLEAVMEQMVEQKGVAAVAGGLLAPWLAAVRRPGLI